MSPRPRLLPSFALRRRAASRPVPLHEDPGLQPERTVLSWDRTLLALVVASLMFVRWYPEVGVWSFAPAAVAAVAGAVIRVTQRRRYQAQATGIAEERVTADLAAVGATVLMVVLMAALGLTAVWAGAAR